MDTTDDQSDEIMRANFGRTMLHAAAFETDAEYVRNLIEEGADPNARDLAGNTPLMLTKDGAVAKALIAGGADTEARDEKGRTVLHQNAFGLQHQMYDYSNPGMVAALLEGGADVNARDNAGKTPLHQCLNYLTVTQLVKGGADVNAVDHAGVKVDQYFNEEMGEVRQSSGLKTAAIVAAQADMKTPEVKPAEVKKPAINIPRRLDPTEILTPVRGLTKGLSL